MFDDKTEIATSPQVENPLTRRDFTRTALGLLAGATFGCSRQDPTALPSLSFEELVEALDTRYGVREFQKLDDRTIVYFTDRHVMPVQEENTNRIMTLETIWDLELLGLENYVGHPDSEQHKAATSRNDAIFYIPAEAIWVPPSGADQAATALYSPNSGGYRHLFNRPEFVTCGIEDGDLWAKAGPACAIEDHLNALMEVVGMNGYTAVSYGGKYTHGFEQLRRSEQLLVSRYADYPQFDFSRINNRTEVKGKELVLIGPEDAGLIGESAFRFRTWFLKHGVAERNPSLVNNILSAMDHHGFMRAALVAGKDHSESHTGWDLELETIQQLLKKKEISYIVVDYRS